MEMDEHLYAPISPTPWKQPRFPMNRKLRQEEETTFAPSGQRNINLFFF
jgi:hypothetical protein